MLIQTLFVAGIALSVSSAAVLFRDLRDIVANLLQLGFFMTPILYLIDNIDSRFLRAILHMNPMTPFVVGYQKIFFFGTLPSLFDTALMLAYAAGSLILGFFIFDRLRDTLAEAI
jgi:lipopolysaccharide transport system permease protein